MLLVDGLDLYVVIYIILLVRLILVVTFRYHLVISKIMTYLNETLPCV